MDFSPKLILPSICDIKARITKLENKIDSLQIGFVRGYTVDGYSSTFNKFIVKKYLKS
jgi:hypothetical protein